MAFKPLGNWRLKPLGTPAEMDAGVRARSRFLLLLGGALPQNPAQKRALSALSCLRSPLADCARLSANTVSDEEGL